MNDIRMTKQILQSSLKCFSIYKVCFIKSRPLNILTEYLNKFAVKILITEAVTMVSMMYKLKSKPLEMSLQCFWLFISIPLI